jgi:hypothetical protein
VVHRPSFGLPLVRAIAACPSLKTKSFRMTCFSGSSPLRPDRLIRCVAAATLAAAFVPVCGTAARSAEEPPAAETARKEQPVRDPELQVAASQFAITPSANAATSSRTGARAGRVAGPLKTTVLLLEDGDTRLCLVTTHFGGTAPVNVNQLLRRTLAGDLQLPESHVLICNSHNHSSVSFASNGVAVYRSNGKDVPPVQLLPVGEKFLAELRSHAKRLPDQLQPVSVWWAVGHEDRITYNRKGRRADGSTYFMREEDRVELGSDFRGDVDTQAPVIVFRSRDGKSVAALTQFTGHPVTSYHPERPVVFGEWPQVACDDVATHLDPEGSIPVGFLQGCAGDVNSKEMFQGGVERATEFGHMLGESWIEALGDLRPSRHDGLDVVVENVDVPLRPLPSRQVLIEELREMDAFIQRASAGDEQTLHCVGLNFPQALSPAYRARLVEAIRPWNLHALKLHEQDRADAVPQSLPVEVAVIRIGDVGIVGLPCEPFQGIGRLIRKHSPLPVSIPCGYTNVSHGYITDGANTGDREYMSSFYRYTDFRPPLKKPAGDVLATRATEILTKFVQQLPQPESTPAGGRSSSPQPR